MSRAPTTHRADARFPGRAEVELPPDLPPTLLVVLDTEEEFDWRGPFDRANTGVESMRAVDTFQELCDARGVRPTYVITYPIATQRTGSEPLARFVADGRAQVGAHQHPWVCPPFEEEVNAFHSYPGNLPEALERAKLETLTAAIEATFGARPTLYKAGRYGFGPNTARILADLGYEIDLSPCSYFDHSADGGPDDSSVPPRPFSFGDGLFSFPTTAGFPGRLPSGAARRAYELSRRPALAWSRMTGILARTGLVERVRLSPEGYTLDELVRVTRRLGAEGEAVLSLTLHTPSLAPGNTPFVRDAADRDRFLATIRDYLTFFFDDLGGRASTPHDLRDLLLSRPGRQPRTSP